MPLPGSGAPTIVINTRERVVSDDTNRLQAKEAQWVAELARFMFDADNQRDTQSAGVASMGTGIEGFLRGTVVSGLCGKPDVGTANLFVTPGVCVLIDNPSPGADDSLAAVVADAGVSAPGALVLTPGSAATRIDVLECQRVTNVLESANRDIFNLTTGQFTPTQVDKVRQGQLVYRLRVGTPGSGFPGVAAGWMPLMVARVTSTSTTWDDVICWDVRPLAADRRAGPWRSTRSVPTNERTMVYSDVTSDAAQVRLIGEIDAEFQGYRAGGQLAKSSVVPYLDITDADQLAPGFVGFGTSAAQLWHLYSVFPFQLPRWVRLTESASGSRVPGGWRGIPCVSVVQPHMNGMPVSPLLQTPLSSGLGDAAGQPAICLLAGCGDVTGSSTVPQGVMCDGSVVYPLSHGGQDAAFSGGSTTTTGSTASLIKGPVTALGAAQSGFRVPGNARRVKIRFTTTFGYPTASAAGTEVRLAATITDGLGSSTVIVERNTLTWAIVTAQNVVHDWDVWLPLVQPPAGQYTVAGALGVYTVGISFPSATFTTYGHSFTVIGWEL